MNVNNMQSKMINILKNKYVFTALIFFLWLLIFDQNNLIDRSQNIEQLEQLKKDKLYYQERIEHAKNRLNELKTDERTLEKFAREQYLMKRENEDVFVVVKENN